MTPMFPLYYGYRYYGASTGTWITRDPLGQPPLLQHLFTSSEDPECAPNLFVHNNPNTCVDPLGLWPSQYHFLGLIWWPVPRTHQNAVSREIQSLEFGDTDTIIAADVWVDGGPHFQDTVNSFMHAMKAPDQSEADARRRANLFVRNHLTKAQELLCKSCGRGTTRDMALWEFGMALHTVQDYTSPAHHFQTWPGGAPIFGIPNFDVIDHLQAEYYDPGPNSNLDKATKWLWTFFECEYGAPPMPDDFFKFLDWDHPR